MKKQLLTTVIASIAMTSLLAQTKTTSVPRIVVGITIDQLRSDYLKAFMPLYGEGGFKLLLEKGQVYPNVQYMHSNVDRASAVASVYTGTAPYNHGIISEYWLNRAELQTTYCVSDREEKGINTSDGSSARKLMVSTLSDEIKSATQGKGKVYSIAPERDAAILSAGHLADWAMWIDNETGKWAGTTYYGEEPSWFKQLGANSISNRISSLVWKPSGEFSGTYNYYLSSNQKAFSHNFNGNSRFNNFKKSGLVNEEVTNVAKYCIDNSQLGADETPDLLSICYYAGDYISNEEFENTTELQDTYKRLDAEIETLIKKIDKNVGLNNALIFITSTGYDQSTSYRIINDKVALEETKRYSLANSKSKNTGKKQAIDYRLPTGSVNINRCSTLLNMYLCAMYNNGQYVEGYYRDQIYLNHKLIEQKQLKMSEVLAHCEDFLFQFEGIQDVYTSHRLTQGAWTPGISEIRNGYNPKISGDIQIHITPGWDLEDEDRHTTKHQRDSFFEFPVIFFGYNIQSATNLTPIKVNCIAPTIAHHIRIRAPNACNTPPLF